MKGGMKEEGGREEEGGGRRREIAIECDCNAMQCDSNAMRLQCNAMRLQFNAIAMQRNAIEMQCDCNAPSPILPPTILLPPLSHPSSPSSFILLDPRFSTLEPAPSASSVPIVIATGSSILDLPFRWSVWFLDLRPWILHFDPPRSSSALDPRPSSGLPDPLILRPSPIFDAP